MAWIIKGVNSGDIESEGSARRTRMSGLKVQIWYYRTHILYAQWMSLLSFETAVDGHRVNIETTKLTSYGRTLIDSRT